MVDLTIEDKVLTVADAREYFGGCIPGWQSFAERYGFEWQTVIRHGLLASQLLATGDAMAIQLVEWKYEQEG